MKTLAIIGASYLQEPLVRKAKEMGLRTICFAWADGAVCQDVCDRFYPISIIEKESILEVCRRERIDGITTIATDVAMPTVSYVAAAMGLVGNTEHSAYLCTNKQAMRSALVKGGVNCPRFASVSSVAEAESAAADIGYPVIVKPCDRSGSMGVSEVRSSAGLATAVEAAIDASFVKQAMVEQLVDIAQEISVEGISWKGEHHVLAITDKVTTGAPHYVEIGQHQPSRLPGEIIDEAIRQVKLGVKALDIQYGASHPELMIDRSGAVYVTEIGGRMGGDFIGSDLVWLSTGYDFLGGVIEIALGSFSGVSFGKRHCAGVWFYSPDTPWVGDVVRNRANWPQIVRSEIHEDELKPLARSADRAGYFIYQSDRYFDKQGNGV